MQNRSTPANVDARHDWHDPSVSVFVLAIALNSVGSNSLASAFNLTVTWNADAMGPSWHSRMTQRGAIQVMS